LTTRSPGARNAYVDGMDRLLSADAGIVAAFEQALATDEGFALAHIALARTLQVQGRGSEVKAPLERGRALAAGTTEREQSHIAVFEKILTGRGSAAIPAILEHLETWPRDAMVLAPITGVRVPRLIGRVIGRPWRPPKHSRAWSGQRTAGPTNALR